MKPLEFMQSWTWDRLPRWLQVANWLVGIPLVVVWVIWLRWEAAAAFVTLWLANAVAIWRHDQMGDR